MDVLVSTQMSGKSEPREQRPVLFTSKGSTSSSKSSKSSILRKKLQAEKVALERKIAEQKCEEEIKLFRTETERRVVVLELKEKAEESKLEYEFEDALAKEDFVSNNADIIDEELSELPVDSVNDRVSRLGTNSALVVQNAEADEQLASKVNQSSAGDGKKSLKHRRLIQVMQINRLRVTLMPEERQASQ